MLAMVCPVSWKICFLLPFLKFIFWMSLLWSYKLSKTAVLDTLLVLSILLDISCVYVLPDHSFLFMLSSWKLSVFWILSLSMILHLRDYHGFYVAYFTKGYSSLNIMLLCTTRHHFELSTICCHSPVENSVNTFLRISSAVEIKS